MPIAILVVCPTGGGKSLLRDVCGITLGGVTLTIVPLLSLGADQTQKVNSRASLDCLTVVAFHLDELSLAEFDLLFPSWHQAVKNLCTYSRHHKRY
jgi:hypothetical protein